MKKPIVCLIGLFGLASLLPRSAMAAKPPRVAVFSQIGFPFYNVSPLVSPKTIAANLRSAGVQADLLGAAALADAARLNRRTYDAVILPYGNTYPQPAFANLRTFHRGGGSLILSGVPFTHPVAALGADKWSANPSWSNDARLVKEAHSGKTAVQLRGITTNWVGVSSGRYPVKAGQTVKVSAWTQNVRGVDAGNDWLYLRFYGGPSYLSQEGPKIPVAQGWQQASAEIGAPEGATEFDISPQIRTPGRVVRLDDISISVSGKAIAVTNAGFETPSKDWNDTGHEDGAALFGPNGMGIGNFADQPTAAVRIPANDLLNLKSLKQSWPRDPNLQVIDASSLPAGVQLKPVLLEGNKPTAALLVHKSGAFKGAVDAWTNHPATADLTAYDTEQLLSRATIAALVEKGALPASAKPTAFAALLKQNRPKVYANVVLPVVKRWYPTLQPKMPVPARHLYVADIRPMKPEEQLLLTSLQGIVNRTKPRIYLLSDETDRFWLEQMQKQGQTDAPIEVVSPLTLVKTFRSSIKGAVVPDPKVYSSPNIAASIAGLDNVVIATPVLAKQLNLPIKTDLRGRFKSNADALRYTRTVLMPRLNPYLSICLDPPLLGNGSMDQIIAAKGLAFWIT